MPYNPQAVARGIPQAERYRNELLKTDEFRGQNITIVIETY